MAFRHGDERGRRDQPEARVLPPDQGFEAGERPVDQVDSRGRGGADVMLVGTPNEGGNADGATSGDGEDDMPTTLHRPSPARQTTMDGFPLVHVDYALALPRFSSFDRFAN
jgi:hypothetical protein